MKLKDVFYYKYIHLMYGHDTKFTKPLLELFSNKQNGFDMKEHLFVTPYENVFNELSVYSNVVLDMSGKNLYRKYYSHCQLMISHSSDTLKRLLMTPKKVKKRIVYRYWGGIRLSADNGNWGKWKLCVKKYLFKKGFSDFAAIGVANITDIIDLSNVLGKNIKYYYLSYASNDYYSAIKDTKDELKRCTITNERKKVLVGHRGTEENNHIEILKKLEKYDPEKFEVYIPLSYGDKKYIEKVERYISDNCKKNVVVVKKFMEFHEYVKFLSQMDIAIFDGNTSYALGNLEILLFFEKVIYLNETGVIAKAFDMEKSPYRRISDIGGYTFEKFSEVMEYPENFSSDLSVMSMEDRLMNWKKLFTDFSINH